MDELKTQIAKNLIFYRKRAGLTQSELAEKLNYSDKSISKWERGEGVPDIFVMNEISQLYQVSIDLLVNEECDETLPLKGNDYFIKKLLAHKNVMICLLSIAIVWLVATTIYIFPAIITGFTHRFWLVFVYAIPITFLILGVFSYFWRKYVLSTVAISLFATTVIFSFIITFYSKNIWLLLLLILPVQSVIILLYILKINSKKLNKNL